MGDALFGAYRRGVLIGRGATCDVYEARRTDSDDDGLFALKVPTTSEGKRALLREAEVSARLTHPRVVGAVESVHDMDGEVVALAMRMLRGKRLSALCAERGKLPWRWVVSCLVQVLEAVEAIHRAGYLHGDVKPGNIMMLGDAALDAEPDAMLFDLGGALPLCGSGSRRDEKAERPAITAAYAGPEVYAVDHRGAASDIYSVAVMAFELLSGIRPFTGETDEEIAYKHIHHEPPRVERVDASADIPAHVALAVHRGLAKDPEDRFSTARDFAAALAAE